MYRRSKAGAWEYLPGVPAVVRRGCFPGLGCCRLNHWTWSSFKPLVCKNLHLPVCWSFLLYVLQLPPRYTPCIDPQRTWATVLFRAVHMLLKFVLGLSCSGPCLVPFLSLPRIMFGDPTVFHGCSIAFTTAVEVNRKHRAAPSLVQNKQTA